MIRLKCARIRLWSDFSYQIDFWPEQFQTMVQTVVRSNFRPDSVISVWDPTGVRSVGLDHKAFWVCTSTCVVIFMSQTEKPRWTLSKRCLLVEVQSQFELWSDPLELTPVCSQTEITGSGQQFERKIVWAMVWFRSEQRSIRSGRSDQSPLRSERSDQSVIPAHLSLIRGRIERIWSLSEAMSCALESEKSFCISFLMSRWPWLFHEPKKKICVLTRDSFAVPFLRSEGSGQKSPTTN